MEKDVAAYSFDRLIHILDQYGIIPDLSTFYMAQRPIVLINHGTHRLGYLMSRFPNVFVSVRLIMPFRHLWFPIDGIKYCLDAGYPQKEVMQMIERYKEGLKAFHRYYIAVVNEKYSRLFEESCIDGRNISTIISKQAERLVYNSYTTDMNVFKDYIFVLSRLDNVVIYKLEVMSQQLKYKKRRLCSLAAGRIHDKMKKEGKSWGIISMNITESIKMEIMLSEIYNIKLK